MRQTDWNRFIKLWNWPEYSTGIKSSDNRKQWLNNSIKDSIWRKFCILDQDNNWHRMYVAFKLPGIAALKKQNILWGILLHELGDTFSVKTITASTSVSWVFTMQVQAIWHPGTELTFSEPEFTCKGMIESRKSHSPPESIFLNSLGKWYLSFMLNMKRTIQMGTRSQL